MTRWIKGQNSRVALRALKRKYSQPAPTRPNPPRGKNGNSGKHMKTVTRRRRGVKQTKTRPPCAVLERSWHWKKEKGAGRGNSLFLDVPRGEATVKHHFNTPHLMIPFLVTFKKKTTNTILRVYIYARESNTLTSERRELWARGNMRVKKAHVWFYLLFIKCEALRQEEKKIQRQ